MIFYLRCTNEVQDNLPQNRDNSFVTKKIYISNTFLCNFMILKTLDNDFSRKKYLNQSYLLYRITFPFV